MWGLISNNIFFKIAIPAIWLVIYPLSLDSCGCSLGKFHKSQVQKVNQMSSELSGKFYGLGINQGASNWEAAETEAKLDALAGLSEHIQVQVKSMTRLITEQKKEIRDSLYNIILTISEVNLKNVSYIETGHLTCDSKYYVAIVATKSKEEYYDDYIKLIPTSIEPLLHELFKNADPEVYKELKTK